MERKVAKILNNVWSRSEGKTLWLPERLKDGTWLERKYAVGLVEDYATISPPMGDWYFSPLRYKSGWTREKATVHKPGVLFADLDGVDPLSLDFEPSLAWMTSNAMYQAIWFLTEPQEDKWRWERLNKAVTYSTGADKGGWSLSKVLRVPESLNWKRQIKIGSSWFIPMGEIVSYKPEIQYDFSYLEKEFSPETVSLGGTPQDMPDLSPLRVVQIKSEWAAGKLFPSTWHFMDNPKGSESKSQALWKVTRSLKEQGVPVTDAFALLLNAKVNKWRPNKERLWADVCRAYDKP